MSPQQQKDHLLQDIVSKRENEYKKTLDNKEVLNK